jgi:hypothetical protein
MLSTNLIIQKANSYEKVLDVFLIGIDGLLIDYSLGNNKETIDKDYLSSIYLKVYDEIKKTSIRINKKYPQKFIIETDLCIIGIAKIIINNETFILVINFDNKIDTSKVDVFLEDIFKYFS